MKNSTKKRKMTNAQKKMLGIAAGVLALSMLMVGSIAYFTDRANGNSSVNVGNLQIELTDLNVNTNEVIAPGCIVPMSYSVKNTGTLAADEREKIALSVFGSDGSTPVTLSSSPSEFEIYKREDVELVSGKGYAPKSGVSPIGTRVTDGFSGGSGSNRIIYQVNQEALNGSDMELGDSVSTSLNRDFVILFKGTSGNQFQNVVVNLDVLVEAKQHAYTSAYDNDWSELQSKSVEFSSGNQNVVPARSET